MDERLLLCGDRVSGAGCKGLPHRGTLCVGDLCRKRGCPEEGQPAILESFKKKNHWQLATCVEESLTSCKGQLCR